MSIKSIDKLVLSAVLALSSATAMAAEQRGSSRPGRGDVGGGYRPEPPRAPEYPRAPQNPGYGGGNNGGYNPNPRPGPGPGPAPRSSIIGQVTAITDRGEVVGWACATDSRAALRLVVYINGSKEYSLSPEANLDTRMDRQMGVPDRDCGDQSGFKFQLPRERFDGSVMRVDVRGVDRYSREEIFLGDRTYRTPVDFIRETLFTVGPRTYYSNGRDAFCNVVSNDQVKIMTMGGRVRVTDRLDRLPGSMRNDGDCVQVPVPKSIFTSRATGITGWFSNGTNAYCALPFPGMLVHIAAAAGIPTRAEQYDAMPDARTQANHGSCKVEGLFSIGADVYYSNGQNAFCHLTRPEQIGGRRVFPYEGFPPDQANHGDCK